MASEIAENEQPPELFRKSKATDITLLVGGQELHFAKFPLPQGSDVFAQMIEDSANQSKLQIDDVAYKDMILFLECLHPRTLVSIKRKIFNQWYPLHVGFNMKGS